MRNSGAFAIALALVVALAGGAGTARGQDFTFGVNTPTELQGTLFMANQTIDYSSSGAPNYVLDFNGGGLEESIDIDALTLLPVSGFLFSTDAPFTVGSDTFMPHDVVRFDAGTFSMYLAGSSLGLSDSANIDALAFDSAGRLALSFDAPESAGGNDYEFNDIVVVDGVALSLLVSGPAIGLPSDLDVTGYERAPDGSDLFHFASPVTLGAVDFTPSDIARYSGGTWSVHFHDPAFPTDSSGTDFSLPCAGPPYAGSLTVGRPGGSTEVAWSSAGVGLFDVVRGDLSALRSSGGNFTQALDAIAPASDVCLGDDTALLAITDTKADPSPGGGYFYLLRPVAGCRAGGTYDSGGPGQVGGRDVEIEAAAADCS